MLNQTGPSLSSSSLAFVQGLDVMYKLQDGAIITNAKVLSGVDRLVRPAAQGVAQSREAR